jgi:hypothetical protein
VVLYIRYPLWRFSWDLQPSGVVLLPCGGGVALDYFLSFSVCSLPLPSAVTACAVPGGAGGR